MKENTHNNNANNALRRLTGGGVCLAAALLLPFLTGQIPQVGSMLLPMHLPVLLCGLVCGWQYGLAVGFVAPALRFILFGMPPIFPTGAAMMFELAAYGCAAGLLYRLSGRVLPALIGAMLAGRLVWGGVMWAIAAYAADVSFGLAVFFAQAFANAVPGILLQLAVLPPLVYALKKAGYVFNGA